MFCCECRQLLKSKWKYLPSNSKIDFDSSPIHTVCALRIGTETLIPWFLRDSGYIRGLIRQGASGLETCAEALLSQLPTSWRRSVSHCSDQQGTNLRLGHMSNILALLCVASSYEFFTHQLYSKNNDIRRFKKFFFERTYANI